MRTIVGIVALVVFLACPILSHAQMMPVRQPSGITVNGIGEVKADPDIAYISLGVQTKNKEAALAATENAKRTTAVVKALKAAGIADKDIETTRYTVQPVYDYKTTPPVLTNYEVSNVVKVTMSDLNKIGAILDTALAAGVNKVQGVYFELKDETSFYNRALIAAVSDAKAKAQLLADQLNVKLGTAISVKETEESLLGHRAQGMYAGTLSVETPINPEQITVGTVLQITFAIIGM